ncbi:MAG: MarR family transcriptional regulator [Armatimonas sp.]
MSASLIKTAEVEQLSQALHVMAGVFDLSAGLDRFLSDIPVAQRRCLVVLSIKEGATMQQLATRLGAKAPAMSQVIDRLVRRGVVERQTDDMDRRVCRLYLTDSGRSMVQHARGVQDERLRGAIESLRPDLRESVLHGIQALNSYEDHAKQMP